MPIFHHERQLGALQNTIALGFTQQREIRCDTDVGATIAKSHFIRRRFTIGIRAHGQREILDRAGQDVLFKPIACFCPQLRRPKCQDPLNADAIQFKIGTRFPATCAGPKRTTRHKLFLLRGQ